MNTSVPSRAAGRIRTPVFLAVAIAVAMTFAGCEEKEAPAAAPAEVYVSQVIQKDVPVYMEVVGQTKGSEDVEIRARAEGYLERVAFTEGSHVRKGELLYEIDRKPLEAALANAQADLATWESHLQKTNNDVARYRPLAEQQAISRQELDNAVSAQEAARSRVEAAKASKEKARLDLGYTRITSPIEGFVGTTLVKVGNLVGRGESTLLTTIYQIDPILFRAGISEAEYLRLKKRLEEAGAHEAQARTDPKAEIELLLADGTVHPHKGRVDVIETAVDPTTGTLTVQFKFPNPGGVLRPGQYGRARFVIEQKTGALLVPQRAVQELQNLYSLAVVEAGNKVRFQNVKVGPRVGNLWVIEEGLKPGDSVVVEGLQRVREGAVVTPKPLPPSSEGSGAAEPAAATAGEAK